MQRVEHALRQHLRFAEHFRCDAFAEYRRERQAARAEAAQEVKGKAAQVVIRGTEGMAVQLATCCRPIPGDAIVGSMKKGQGLVVHAADCKQATRSRRIEPEQWLDVEWDRKTTRLFHAAVRVTVTNQRGVLAKVASEIAEAGSM